MTATAPRSDLLSAPMRVIDVGVDSFQQSIANHGGESLHLDWKPPGEGDPTLAWQLAQLMGDASDAGGLGAKIDQANQLALQKVLTSQPVLVDVALRADEVWPDMGRTLLHAGAPVAWEAMCGPMQGAAIGALLYEGWAKDSADARAQLAGGKIPFAQCHDYQSVGPMTGIISASMPVFVVKNQAHGNMAYTNLNEGIGKCLRFGANSPEVITRLKWFETVLAPALKAAVKQAGGIDLKSIQSQALLMGDEVHSRNAAATALFFMQLATALSATTISQDHQHQTLKFIRDTSQFFLNLSMVACKATMDAAHGIEHSTLVTCMARNGVTTGIRVSGLGQQWFEAPSGMPQGLFFPGFKAEDSNPDLGDSAITETAGYGGFSLAASPALTLLVGGSVGEAVGYSKLMENITVGRNPGMSLPNLEFAGAPVGIDIRKVVDTGIRPVITTGIAHKEAGIGQIGAGIVRAPMACFTKALAAFAAHAGVA
jgi:hypothetical protein